MEVVKGGGHTPLSQNESAAGSHRDDPQAEGRRARAGQGGEIDRENEGGDHHDGEQPAEVVDRIRGLVDVRRHVALGEHERHDRQRERDDKHRLPIELGQEGTRDQWSQR